MTREIDLAVIPGDGIGVEVIEQANLVLDAVVAGTGTSFTRTEYMLGAAAYLETGETLNDDTLQKLAGHDAILFGAVGGVPGDPRLRHANIERGLLLRLRFEFDHFVNLRPATLYPGCNKTLTTGAPIDFVVVREGTEGPYAGNGGTLRRNTPQEIATEVSVNTAYGIERVARYAFQTAAAREKKHLTWVHKTNVLVHAGATWQKTIEKLHTEYAHVHVDYMHIDAATIHMVQNPERFDVVVTDNLFGDILTDLAGAITGGIGLAASGNINPTGKFPSMFEPVHGSAPDIAGKGLANPSAAVLSAALMLDHLGLQEEAARVKQAVREDLAANGSSSGRSTAQIGRALTERIAKQ